MNATQSIVVGGKEFPYFAMTLVLSPILRENDVSYAVVLSLKPLRIGEEGPEILQEPEYVKNLTFGDLLASEDANILACFASVQQTIQQLILEKNL